MPPHDPPSRFVARVRRRWIASRLVETAARMTLLGAGIAMLSALLLWTTPLNRWMPAPSLVAGTAFIGLVVSWMHRPTMLDSAARIDQHLHLHELLATALTLSPDHPWRRMILTRAQQALAHQRPSTVPVRQLRWRGWSAIIVALLLLFAVRALDQTLILAHTPQPAPGPTAQAPSAPNPTLTGPSQHALEKRFTPHPSAPDHDHPMPDTQAEPFQQPSRLAQDAVHPRATSRTPANGSGGQQASDPTHHASRPTSVRGSDAAAPNQLDGSPAPGAGTSDLTASADGPSGSTGGINRAQPLAPWQTTGWSSEQARARQQLGRGAIPPGRRDLVREYFSLQTSN